MRGRTIKENLQSSGLLVFARLGCLKSLEERHMWWTADLLVKYEGCCCYRWDEENGRMEKENTMVLICQEIKSQYSIECSGNGLTIHVEAARKTACSPHPMPLLDHSTHFPEGAVQIVALAHSSCGLGLTIKRHYYIPSSRSTRTSTASCRPWHWPIVDAGDSPVILYCYSEHSFQCQTSDWAGIRTLIGYNLISTMLIAMTSLKLRKSIPHVKFSLKMLPLTPRYACS